MREKEDRKKRASNLEAKRGRAMYRGSQLFSKQRWGKAIQEAAGGTYPLPSQAASGWAACSLAGSTRLSFPRGLAWEPPFDDTSPTALQDHPSSKSSPYFVTGFLGPP